MNVLIIPISLFCNMRIPNLRWECACMQLHSHTHTHTDSRAHTHTHILYIDNYVPLNTCLRYTCEIRTCVLHTVQEIITKL